MSNAALKYTPREDLAEPGSEQAFAGWKSRNHIQIGFNVIVNCATTRPARERDAILWLANYAHRERMTADQLTEQLGMDRAGIRAALTNPEVEIKQFVNKVESMRSVLDNNLPKLAETKIVKEVTEACEFAMETGSIVEIIGKTRIGKTDSVELFYLRNLHRSAYIVAPATESYSDWIFAVARAIGISVGNGKKVTQIEAQIRVCLRSGAINFVIVDEGQRLWPSDIRLKPKRLEFLRTLWDENRNKIGIAVVATPQFTISLNQAMKVSTRWAPGQWDGRVVRFLLPDTLTDGDLGRVAKHRCPEANEEMVRQLVLGAKATQGFCGSMVNVLKLARFRAGKGDITLEAIIQAQAQMARGSKIELLAKGKA